MAAPTAKLDQSSNEAAQAAQAAQTAIESIDDSQDEVLIDASNPSDITSTNESNPSISTTSSSEMIVDQDGRPKFPAATSSTRKVKIETRSIAVPPHRFSPLKSSWTKVYLPLVQHLKLQVRMDIKNKKVMIRTCKLTTDPGALQKGVDFLSAFTLGFDIDDAVALLRLDDLYIETFEIKDVKTLNGDHLSRAIARIAGKDGKTKFAIENASRTRVVLADSKIHILGGFANIKIARETIVSLILGAPPGKVYGNLRKISSRMKERY